jgi:hypothetical protein
VPRKIDVASFSPLNNANQISVTLRGYVSQTVHSLNGHLYQEAAHSKPQKLTVHVGLVGQGDEPGRSTPQEDYVNVMFESKIVVTAQRDRHEDHYRFFEAIASGAMVMTDPMHPLPHGYKDKENVVVYASLQELKDLIIFFLQNAEERLRIAKAGFELAMSEHRSWHAVERILL